MNVTPKRPENVTPKRPDSGTPKRVEGWAERRLSLRGIGMNAQGDQRAFLRQCREVLLGPLAIQYFFEFVTLYRREYLTEPVSAPLPSA